MANFFFFTNFVEEPRPAPATGNNFNATDLAGWLQTDRDGEGGGEGAAGWT